MQKVHFRLTSVAQKRCCLSSLFTDNGSQVLIISKHHLSSSFIVKVFPLLKSKPAKLTWNHALFSFRFVNNIPAGMEPKKTEPLKLGLISGPYKAGVLTDRELERVKKWLQGRGWRVEIGDGEEEGRKNTPAHSYCLFGERPCTGYTGGAAWCSFGCFDCQLPIKATWQVTYPDSSRFWKFWFCPGRILSVLRVTHIAYQWEQKQAIITILSRRDLLASSSSFWFEWRKSWRVNLHVWSLFDLWKVTCTNGSVVQSFSDLTMIATDEECVNSSETACFMTWKKKTQVANRANGRTTGMRGHKSLLL